MKILSSITIAFVLSALVLFTQGHIVYAGFSFAGGAGTAASPWQIATCEQLQNINDEANYLDDYFILTQDIDCSMTNPDDPDFDPEGTWGDETGFIPIGDWASPFTGNFNGAGFSISDLYINRIETSEVGIFSHLGGYVANLDLVNFNITVEGDYVGTLAGQMCGADLAENITVTNVTSSGTVDGFWHVGGLIGSSTPECSHPGQIISSSSSVNSTGVIYVGGLVGRFLGTISDSYATGTITGTGLYVGGLVGLSSGDITSSYASADVFSSGDNVGGLVGEQSDGEISYSFATGEVNGGNRIGGLVGEVGGSGSIVKSYATGAVSATEHFAGGLAGYSYATIADSYTTGNVSGQNYLGGLVGQAEATIYRSYAAGEVSGLNSLGGLVGGIYTEGPAVDVYSCFSAGAITATGGNIGGFAGLATMNHFNSGWVEIAGRPAIGYSTLTSGPVNEIDYNEASTAVFFDATHGVYTAGENEDVWNFTTVWLENEDSYPTLRDMPEEELEEPDPSPPPSPISTPAASPVPNHHQPSNSSSRGSSLTSHSCTATVPATTPDLFQIDSSLMSAKLFFTPSDYNQYFVSFSTKPEAEEFGEQVTLSRDGVQSHNIFHLNPYTTYYVKVRSQNDCMPGNWSNVMTFTTNSQVFYKNSLPVSISATNATNQKKEKVEPVLADDTQPAQLDTQPSLPKASPQPSPMPESSESNAGSSKKCFLWWCW